MIALLQKQVLEKKELADGYSFQFMGSDLIIDQLTEFVKTERQCCEFFTFAIHVSDEKSIIWMDLTGPPGTEDFIENELGF